MHVPLCIAAPSLALWNQFSACQHDAMKLASTKFVRMRYVSEINDCGRPDGSHSTEGYHDDRRADILSQANELRSWGCEVVGI